MILYRPVGMKELELVFLSGMHSFPPRLPEQPIFYPVLNISYASQIARDWNATRKPYAGYVTEFCVDSQFIRKYEPHIVGTSIHEELWIPSEELPDFNAHVIGPIRVVAAYFGPTFEGYVPLKFLFKGKNAIEQFLLLSKVLDYSGMDFVGELLANSLTVFLNHAYWQEHDFSSDGIDLNRKNTILAAISKIWRKSYPQIDLVPTHQSK
jgi:hypothetical protein